MVPAHAIALGAALAALLALPVQAQAPAYDVVDDGIPTPLTSAPRATSAQNGLAMSGMTSPSSPGRPARMPTASRLRP